MKRLVNIQAFILLLLAALVVLCTISCIKEKDNGEFELKVGDSIPDFTVQMNDGSTVTGTSLKTGVALIMFFNTGCPDCQQVLPEIQNLYNEYSSQISFALISREQDDSVVAPYWEEKGYTLPYSAQSDRKVYNKFATSRVPRVYICKDGVIKTIFTDDLVPQYSDLKGAVTKLF